MLNFSFDEFYFIILKFNLQSSSGGPDSYRDGRPVCRQAGALEKLI